MTKQAEKRFTISDFLNFKYRVFYSRVLCYLDEDGLLEMKHFSAPCGLSEYEVAEQAYLFYAANTEMVNGHIDSFQKRERDRLSYWTSKVVGKWRLLWNLCPRCNSDAPEKDQCPVCFGFNGRPGNKRKAKWVQRCDKLLQKLYLLK